MPTPESRLTANSVWKVGEHIPQLDGVRGLAILIVTLYRFSKEIPTDSWLGKALHLLFSFGDRGVDLFFVLSGFLITGILIESKGQPHFFRNFLARRSLRIFPLYFGSLALLLVALQWIAPGNELFKPAHDQQFYLWAYLTNVQMSIQGEWCFGYLDHFWSLAVEEHFYLFWPILLFVLSGAMALRTAMVLASLSAFGRIVFAMISENGVAPDVLTIFRCDALLIGAMLAIQIRTDRGLAPYRGSSLVVLVVSLLIGTACAVLDKRVFTISHTLWPMIWASVLIWLLTSDVSSYLARLFGNSLLRKFGKYSYAMYVFQSPLIPITASIVSVGALTSATGSVIAGNLVYMFAMFCLTYGAALLSWHLFERHFMYLKRYFPTHAPRGSANALDKSGGPRRLVNAVAGNRLD